MLTALSFRKEKRLLPALGQGHTGDVAAARRRLPGGDGLASLNRLAGLAARLLGTESAQVSLLTDVQTVVGGTGLAPGVIGSGSDLSDSLCKVAVDTGESLVVADASDDRRVRDMAPVASGAVGAYLGVPLRTDNAETIGALCVFDVAPRTWSEADVVVLKLLAESVATELELFEARRGAQELAAQVAARALLLAEVATSLAGTLDAGQICELLASAVVPALADWSVVSVIDEETDDSLWGSLRDIAAWHVDPALRPLVERYAELHLGSLNEPSMLARALKNGEPVLIAQGAIDAITTALVPGEAQDLLRVLSPDSAIISPLRAHGRTRGLLLVCRNAGSDRFSRDDVTTVADIAGRAGLALDNARLYGQQRALAEGLQRSLLTKPPQPDHGEIAVRYVAAAEVAQVGGDWYDAFLQPEGATVLVIGDVVGHDTAAAAAMGQIRSLLRGIAVTTGGGPADILCCLDSAMELLQVNTIATAIVARLEQTAEEFDAGVTRLRWSNAGHPPPMAITANGQVIMLGRPEEAGANLLLGVNAHTGRDEFEVILEPGATILLYTDGLVERRRQSLDNGLGRLIALLAQRSYLPLEELCDQVLAGMLPDRCTDDVALVAVRLQA